MGSEPVPSMTNLFLYYFENKDAKSKTERPDLSLEM